MDVAEGEKLDLAGIISTALVLLRDAGYHPDPQLSLAMKALTQAFEFMKVLYPPGHSQDFSQRAVEMTAELTAQSVTEERVKAFAMKHAGYAARDFAQQLPSLQEATNMWLRQYRRGRFEVKVDLSDLDAQMQELRSAARNTTLALIVVGILVASAIAANAPDSVDVGSLREAALVGYAIALGFAAVFAVILVWRGFRRGRETRAAVQARRDGR